jgi:hypothetical protein
MDLSRFTPRSRRHASMVPWAALVALTACLAVGTAPALAQTTFGALSNFDVFNDTGQECHGFEIELQVTPRFSPEASEN